MICRRSDVESCKSNDTEDSDVDFECPISQAKGEENEDWGLPPDLRGMVEQEEKEVKPHREETKIVNLGANRERKEVKVDTCMSINV